MISYVRSMRAVEWQPGFRVLGSFQQRCELVVPDSRRRVSSSELASLKLVLLEISPGWGTLLPCRRPVGMERAAKRNYSSPR
jgi:hypothetical protein